MMGRLLLLWVVLQSSVLLRTEAWNQDDPFIAVWNSVTIKCKRRYNITIPTAEFGIIENTGGVWKGDKMVIFNEFQLGLYPYVTEEEREEDEELVNGGIPQSADFTGHFEKAEADIAATIPDEDFDGVGVIDWESWRPLFDRNWGAKKRYKRRSCDKVKDEHPEWSVEQINAQAKIEFEDAARVLMEDTLLLAKAMRPKATWGYYGFPRCYNYKGETLNCSRGTEELNDKLTWLWEASTALYPTAYLPVQDIENNKVFVYTENREAMRVRDKFCDPNTPILLYTRYTIGGDVVYYTKEQYDASIKMAYDQGFNGVIIWGSSANVESGPRCQTIQDHMNELLGPYTRAVLTNASVCSDEKCSGNGRCYMNDPLGSTKKPSYLENAMERITSLKNHAARRWHPEPRSAEYSCYCYSGWKGNSCSEKNSSP